jgi:glutamate carboxypeptidase
MKPICSDNAILEYLERQVPAMLSLLKELVELESPTGEKRRIDCLIDFLHAQFSRLALPARVTEGAIGNHLIVTKAPGIEDADELDCGSGESGQVLVLCHVDTVWPVGEVARRPFEVVEGKAYGPGALDMKGGIVQTYFALAALKDLGIGPKRRIRLVFTPDEEQGSLSSLALIEREARSSACVLVPEPAAPPSGGLKTGRKGIAKFKITITGRASHAGGDPQRGRSAIEELAHQILRLHALTDYEAGTSVNVGVACGGTRSNVVAASAEAEVDVRFCSMDEGERITQAIKGLSPVLRDIEVSVTGGIERPPMERTPGGVKLFRIARSLALGLGFDVCEEFSGGASDGNTTAAMGIPTLDGLGPLGAGAHADNEHVLISSLPQRAALMAKLFETL